MEMLSAPRLKVALALCVLLAPSLGMANRPKVKPHHKVPKDWRKFVAAKISGVPYKRPASGAVTYATISYASSYGASTMALNFSGGAAAEYVRSAATTYNYSSGSVSFGSSLTINNFSGDVTDRLSESFSLTKTGTGTLLVGGSKFVPTTGVTAGTLTLSGSTSLTGSASGRTLLSSGTAAQLSGSNFVLGNGTTLTFSGGTQNLPASLVAAINDGRLTLAGGAGTVSVEIDPVTNQQTFVVNGQAIPWPSAGSPLTLVNPAAIVATQAPLTLAPSAPFESAAFSADSGLGGVMPVPEPSSALLVLLGAGFLTQRRRRG